MALSLYILTRSLSHGGNEAKPTKLVTLPCGTEFLRDAGKPRDTEELDLGNGN